jgi:hypothetical protein
MKLLSRVGDLFGTFVACTLSLALARLDGSDQASVELWGL